MRIPGRTDTLLKLARKRLGDKIILYADANGSYDAQKGIEVGKMLQDLNFQFFEEPCPWEEISETKKVADALDMKIAAGEQDASLWRFNWMLETGVMQIVQPDLNYNGGFVRAARVARIARKFGFPITPHNTQTGAAGAKILHFAAATAECRRVHGVSPPRNAEAGGLVFAESPHQGRKDHGTDRSGTRDRIRSEILVRGKAYRPDVRT